MPEVTVPSSLGGLTGHRHSRYVIGALLLGGVLLVAVTITWMYPDPPAENITAAAVSSGDIESYESQQVSLLDVLGKLSVAILCIYGVTLGLRWWKDRTRLPGSGGTEQALLTIREQAHLGPKQKLYLIELGQRMVLLGSGEGELSVLVDLPVEEVYPAPPVLPDKVHLTVDDLAEPVPSEPALELHGARIRTRSQRDEQDWPRRREDLIRALQHSE